MKSILTRLAALACVVPLNPAAYAETAMRLKDFEGIEEPEVKCIAATGKFERDNFTNITDAGERTVRIRITTSTTTTGAVLVSVNGDGFQGVKDVAIFRPDATDYRPKWGLYRGITPQLSLGESWVEHKDASAQKL